MKKATKILTTLTDIFTVFVGTVLLSMAGGFLLSILVAGLLLDSFNLYPTIQIEGVVTLVFVSIVSVLFRMSVEKWGWSRYQNIAWWSGLVVSLVLIFLLFLNLRVSRGDSDRYRVANINQFQVAMELYANDNESQYPPLPSSCNDVDVLKQYLVPKYLNSISSDPWKERDYPNYMVAVNSERTEFVVKALLNRAEHSALKTDLDDSIIGCDCDDPNYCIGSNSI